MEPVGGWADTTDSGGPPAAQETVRGTVQAGTPSCRLWWSGDQGAEPVGLTVEESSGAQWVIGLSLPEVPRDFLDGRVVDVEYRARQNSWYDAATDRLLMSVDGTTRFWLELGEVAGGLDSPWDVRVSQGRKQGGRFSRCGRWTYHRTDISVGSASASIGVTKTREVADAHVTVGAHQVTRKYGHRCSDWSATRVHVGLVVP